ncbi:MAG: MBL fold metallo-hydrolase [Verrucomicrobiota bacterium]
MKPILQHHLKGNEAAFWWLGQAGYIVRSADCTIAIDPYLSDSAAAGSPEFRRLYPPPIEPEELRVDIYVITHDHLDHLDPETIRRYPAKDRTWFVAPRLAARRLPELGISPAQIVRLDAGEEHTLGTVQLQGVFALATGAEVLDTTGYLVRFGNGRTFYHTSDTVVHPLVLAAAPRRPDVMVVPINGKWGNPGPELAAAFAAEVDPRIVVPNHYDLMALNAENPETFGWFCRQRSLGARCRIVRRMEPLVWA